jgi:uncharacterized repeat protein (TIGR01451 family)
VLSAVQRGLAVAAISAALALSALAQSADLAVAKNGPDTSNANTDVAYTISVVNAGPDASQLVNLSDTIPAGMTFVSAAQTSGPAFDCTPLPAVGGSGTISCQIAILAAGSSANFIFTFHIPTGTAPGTMFTNTATVSSEVPPDPNSADNTSVAVTTVPQPAADLGVSKSGPDAADANTDVPYTITVLNTGPDASQFVNLSDSVPAGMTFVSATQSSGPAFDCTPLPAVGGSGTITCNIDSFAAGSTAVFIFTFHIPTGTAPGTTFVNIATVSAELPADPNDENNTGVAATTVPPPPQADIFVTKSGPTGAGPNTDVTYTIMVVNPSTNNATNVQLQDTLPGSMTFVSLNQTGGPAMTCVGGATISCTSASFVPGTATFTLVGHIPSGTPPGTTFSNTATVTSTNDPNAENNAATTSLTVSSVDVSVTKTGPATAVAGTNVTYTITIANAGPDTADNVGLTDALPAGTTFVSFAQNNGPVPACSLPNVGANGTVFCNFATLNSGESAAFTLTIKAGNSSPLNNTASGTTDSFDSNTANNSSSVSTVITASADLSIVKTGAASATAGTNITYTIVLTNNGPSDAQTVSWSDALPANTTFVSLAAPAGWTTSTPAVGSPGTATASNPLLTATASATFTLIVKVSSSTPGGTTIMNTATAASTTTDPVGSNNASTTSTSITNSADLTIVKTGPTVAGPGLNVTYTIVLTNNGPSDAQAVSVTDAIPANTTFVSFAAPGGWTTSTPVVGATGTVTTTNALLVAGSSATFTLVVNVNSSASVGTIITNTATATSATPDPTSPNSSTSTATVATGIADLSVTKTSSPNQPQIPANTDVTYTITVTNLGPASASGVTLTDTIPANMTFVSATSTQGSCTGTGPVTCNLGTVNSGSNAIVTVVGRTGSNAPGPTTNTATVSSATPDPNPANNTASATFVAVIPTLSHLILGLLAAVLAAAALLKLK